ncbi:adenylate/guanylate cyclase domain-containing protein [Ramlibacter henchirensis]|uniref:Adenylate/guanylate cyclase domain-containing protein n=1 Tax=Ramlibacter henchirensis TaxID=204072 RepID=A0A4Z0C9M4_9BURK|nr:adenylate/guanylate cyclase domain-containing protein [Ramlibacter henchirensis]TFZ07108.1 adenylate/guanylate cyclase domain-containing protein [Ramlibacter henchirensis]
MQSPPPYSPSRSTRRTRIIMVLDVVESVRLMERDEPGFIRRWQRFVREARDAMQAFSGRIHKSTGDGLMLEFANAEDAIAAAFVLLRISDAGNQGCGEEDRIRLRIAAHVARFVADEYDIYGRGVNLTSRLLGIAKPGEVCITAALRELLEENARRQLEDSGTHQLRHVREPVQVYRVQPVPVTSGPAACA